MVETTALVRAGLQNLMRLMAVACWDTQAPATFEVYGRVKERVAYQKKVKNGPVSEGRGTAEMQVDRWIRTMAHSCAGVLMDSSTRQET